MVRLSEHSQLLSRLSHLKIVPFWWWLWRWVLLRICGLSLFRNIANRLITEIKHDWAVHERKHSWAVSPLSEDSMYPVQPEGEKLTTVCIIRQEPNVVCRTEYLHITDSLFNDLYNRTEIRKSLHEIQPLQIEESTQIIALRLPCLRCRPMRYQAKYPNPASVILLPNSTQCFE
jgi:hypothetical protein